MKLYEQNSEFNAYLKEQVEKLPESTVRQAMAYSLFGKGKQVRPKLLFAVLEDYGLESEKGFPAAAAIEMIHTYSLIHDDLPAMDDDTLRRGRPTCHIAYGEAAAVLAGDALQSLAFETLCQSACDGNTLRALVRELAAKSGAAGIVYGQILDLETDQNAALADTVRQIELCKTGCLLQAPLVMGCLLAGCTEDLPIWEEIGALAGIEFQIQDDILDATSTSEALGKSNSDQDNEKPTILAAFTLEQAQAMVKSLDAQIRRSMEKLSVPAEKTGAFLDALLSRTS